MVPDSRMDPDILAALDAAMLFIHPAAVDEMAFRLCGLSGDAFRRECVRLTEAVLSEMATICDEIGDFEKTVVLATLKAAVYKAAGMQAGLA